MITVLRLIKKGIKDLTSNPWDQLCTLIAITLVVFLGLLFLLTLYNLNQYASQGKGKVTFELFWLADVPTKIIEEQCKSLKKDPKLESIKTYSPDQALKVLTASMGKNNEFSWLEDKSNPLPYTAVLSYKFLPQNFKDQAQSTYKTLQDLKGIDKVHYNPFKVTWKNSLYGLIKKFMFPLIVFFLFLVGLIIANTFRLSQKKQKEEIEILRLIGAGRWYIQVPLSAGSCAQAIAGSLLALLLLKIFQHYLNVILNSPPLWVQIYYISDPLIWSVLGANFIVGIGSSLIAGQDLR